MAAKWSFGGPLQSIGPPKDHLAAFGRRSLVVKFNVSNIMEMSPMLLSPPSVEGRLCSYEIN